MPGPVRILVIEDEDDIRELVRFNLERAGYLVMTASTGEGGLLALREHRPDCIVLDRMLPGMDGLDLCRSVRSRPEMASIPVILVTAKGEEEDIVHGLEIGADDYIPKPFSPRVLLARVEAVLRRGRQLTSGQEDAEVNYPGLSLHPGMHEVRVHGIPITLTASEFKILRLLCSKPGWVFSRAQIVRAIRGSDYPVTERSIDVQMVGLRKKLGALGSCLSTVRGTGYRFKPAA